MHLFGLVVELRFAIVMTAFMSSALGNATLVYP